MALCRAALDRLKQVNSDFENQQSELVSLREVADAAFDTIMQHRDRSPRAAEYPSAAELAEHAAEENRLVRSHQDAVAKVREANERLGWLGADLLKRAKSWAVWNSKNASSVLLRRPRFAAPSGELGEARGSRRCEREG